MCDDTDSSMAEWLDLSAEDIRFADDYCGEEDGIFWGAITDTERQYVDKWLQQFGADRVLTADDESLDMTSPTGHMSGDNYSLFVSSMGSQSMSAGSQTALTPRKELPLDLLVAITSGGVQRELITDATDDYHHSDPFNDFSMISTSDPYLLSTASAGHVSINDYSLFVSPNGSQSAAGSVGTPSKGVDLTSAYVSAMATQSFAPNVSAIYANEVDVMNATDVSQVIPQSFFDSVSQTPIKEVDAMADSITAMASKCVSDSPLQEVDTTVDNISYMASQTIAPIRGDMTADEEDMEVVMGAKNDISFRANTSVKFNTSVRVRHTSEGMAPIDMEMPIKCDDSSDDNNTPVVKTYSRQTSLKSGTPVINETIDDSVFSTSALFKSRVDSYDNTTPLRDSSRSHGLETPLQAIVEDRDELEMADKVVELDAKDLLSPFDINKTMGNGALEVDVPITQSLIGLTGDTTGRPLTQSTPRFVSKIPKPKATYNHVATPRYSTARDSFAKPLSVHKTSRQSSQLGVSSDGTDGGAAEELSASSLTGRTSRSRKDYSLGLQSIVESPISAMESATREESLAKTTTTPLRANTSVKFSASVRVRTASEGMASMDKETPIKSDDSAKIFNASIANRVQTPFKDMTPLINRTLEDIASNASVLNKTLGVDDDTPLKNNNRWLRIETPVKEDMEAMEVTENMVEVVAEDLLSPFGLNKSVGKAFGKAVPVTMSLVDINTATVEPVRQLTPRFTKPVARVSSPGRRPSAANRSSGYPLARKSPRLSTIMTSNTSANESTLDFILNEIQCNDSDDNSESFLLNDKQL
ncbi:unnamed protein product, partial [Oppiella nova]